MWKLWEQKGPWTGPLYLPKMANSINKAILPSVGYSPEMIMFGYTINNQHKDPIVMESQVGKEEINTVMRTPITHMNKIINKSFIKSKLEKEKYYNRNKRNKSFQIDQLVLRKVSQFTGGIPKALSIRFTGPYRIREIQDHALTIQHCQNNTITKVHKNHVKPFHGTTKDASLPKAWDQLVLVRSQSPTTRRNSRKKYS